MVGVVLLSSSTNFLIYNLCQENHQLKRLKEIDIEKIKQNKFNDLKLSKFIYYIYIKEIEGIFNKNHKNLDDINYLTTAPF